MDVTIKNLFSEGHSLSWNYLNKHTYPWEMLPEIGTMVKELGETLNPSEYRKLSENVWVANDVSIAPTATIIGPTVIGKGTEVRPGAFIRGNVLVGENCVVGNSTELKNCILFDCVQVPHFNYVGDSILGYGSHTGAGAITSNFRSDKKVIRISNEGEKIETGLRKIGAFLADNVEVGCNSVLNPGTIIGRNSRIYPLSSVRGVVPENSIFKSGKGSEIVRMN